MNRFFNFLIAIIFQSIIIVLISVFLLWPKKISEAECSQVGKYYKDWILLDSGACHYFNGKQWVKFEG